MNLPTSLAASLPSLRERLQSWLFPFLLILLTCPFVDAGPKHNSFQGKVVFAGPEAISVQSESNIYLVRSFRYTPALAKKINKHQPVQGRRVKVHYYRGTDLAFKVN